MTSTVGSNQAALDISARMDRLPACRYLASLAARIALSQLSDRYGRKSTFTFSTVMYSIAAILVAFGPTSGWIDLWRFFAGFGIGIQLIGNDSLLVWLIRRGLPESPRWLASHGRVIEADQVVSEIERRVEAQTGRPLPSPSLGVMPPVTKEGSWREVFGRQYGRGRCCCRSSSSCRRSGSSASYSPRRGWSGSSCSVARW